MLSSLFKLAHTNFKLFIVSLTYGQMSIVIMTSVMKSKKVS